MVINEFQQKKDEFGRRFFYSVLGILIINTICCAVSEYFQMKLYAVPVTFFSVLTLLVAYTGFLLRKISYNFKTVFSTVLWVFFLIFTYLSLLLCKISETVFLYYLPVASLFLMLYSFRKTFIFVVAIMILCFFMPKISAALDFGLDKNAYQNHDFALKFEQYLVIAISVFYSLFILYYNMQFIEIKNRSQNKKILPDDDYSEKMLSIAKTSSVSSKTLSNDEVNEDKLRILYQQIITLFEEEKPFQCKDFSIRVLAEKVNSNTTYVSSALNKIGNKKFNQLVNEYRIEQVKISMAENVHYRFTIEHIYTSAGFSSQSTFNRIFKEYVGITPTEYIENLQNSSVQ